MINFEKYLGLQWKTGGRDAAYGLDCWGLLRYFYRSEFNIDLPEYAAQIDELAIADHVEQGELQGHTWFEIDDVQPGDAVALGRPSGFSHVGVYVPLPEPALLHITASRPVSIITIRDMKRQGFCMFKFYRHVDRIPN